MRDFDADRQIDLFLTGVGNRLTTLLKWTRSFIGSGRPEREFSVMHTGGDLSLPDSVRSLVEPNPLPVFDEGASTEPSSGPQARSEEQNP